MPEQCNTCFTNLDIDGNCPLCDIDKPRPTRDTQPPSKSGDVKHIEGKKPSYDHSDLDGRDLPRTKPIKPSSEDLDMIMDKPPEDDLDEVQELSPDDLKIDFDKLDTSTLFDDEFEDKEISSKMMPVMQKPPEVKIREKEIREAPSEASLRQREVLAIRDRASGQLEGVSYRTKGSMVKKKGQGIVLLIALAIIFIIIFALWITGFLEF